MLAAARLVLKERILATLPGTTFLMHHAKYANMLMLAFESRPFHPSPQPESRRILEISDRTSRSCLDCNIYMIAIQLVGPNGSLPQQMGPYLIQRYTRSSTVIDTYGWMHARSAQIACALSYALLQPPRCTKYMRSAANKCQRCVLFC